MQWGEADVRRREGWISTEKMMGDEVKENMQGHSLFRSAHVSDSLISLIALGLSRGEA